MAAGDAAATPPKAPTAATRIARIRRLPSMERRRVAARTRPPGVSLRRRRVRNTRRDADAGRPHQRLEMLCLSVDIPCDLRAPARARRAVDSLAADVDPGALA